MKKTKGFSVQSIIIGSVITGVIALAGLAYMWDSVEKSKIYIVAQSIDEQDAYIVSRGEFDYNPILSLHASGDGDEDYLDELMEQGLVSKLPIKFFKEPSALTWEIRAVMVDGKPNFYHFLDSTNEDDLELLTSAIKLRGLM